MCVVGLVVRLFKTKQSKARNLLGQVPVDYLSIGARCQKHSPCWKLYARKEGSLSRWEELNLKLENCEYCVRVEDSVNIIAVKCSFPVLIIYIMIWRSHIHELVLRLLIPGELEQFLTLRVIHELKKE